MTTPKDGCCVLWCFSSGAITDTVLSWVQETLSSDWFHRQSRANVLLWQQNTNQASVIPFMQTHAPSNLWRNATAKSFYQFKLGLIRVKKKRKGKKKRKKMEFRFLFSWFSSLFYQQWMLSLNEFPTSMEVRHKLKVGVQYCFVV